MKRSPSALVLSALVFALGLTTASSALGAEPPTDTNDQPSDEPVTQPSDPSPPPEETPAKAPPEPPPATSAPSPAPAPAEAPTPAISIGTTLTTPGADTPKSSAATPNHAPKPRPFAGSSLALYNSMTTGTLFRGQQQYDNPTVESALWMLPRYAINDAFQIRARAILTYEYTNSDSTRYRNEPVLSDTTVQLYYRKLPKVFEFQPLLAANVGLPTSKASRARTTIFAPGATLQMSRGFEHFLKGELLILTALTYSHPIYSSRNPTVADDRPANSFQCLGGTNCSDLLTGTMNPSDTLSYLVLLSPEWGKWNPAIMYLGASQWVYQPKPVQNPVDGTPVTAAPGFEPTSVRQTHYLSAWLDYNINAWLTAEVGYWNSITAIGGNGERANLIFDRYQDTRVYIGGSIQLDNLVKELQGGAEGEAGIVRAKNQKTPMFTF